MEVSELAVMLYSRTGEMCRFCPRYPALDAEERRWNGNMSYYRRI